MDQSKLFIERSDTNFRIFGRMQDMEYLNMVPTSQEHILFLLDIVIKIVIKGRKWRKKKIIIKKGKIKIIIKASEAK